MFEEPAKGATQGAGQDVEELPKFEEQVKGGGPGERRELMIVGSSLCIAALPIGGPPRVKSYVTCIAVKSVG